MFSAALAGGATDLVSVVLGQVFSQLCQENPRTCRGQSRESKNLPRTKPRTKSVRTPTRKLKSQSLVPPDYFPYRNAPDSENIGRRYSPQGGFNPPPYWVGVWDWNTRSPNPPSGFFFSEVLVFPLLNPPPVASGRLPPLRRSAAFSRLGGSWAEKVAFHEAFKN